MKVVVTGAAGMIGSNLVHGLNAIGIDDVIAVDDLTDGPKYRNLLGARLSDYFDRSDFYARFAQWLAAQGLRVTTFDYPGSGESAPPGPKWWWKARYWSCSPAISAIRPAQWLSPQPMISMVGSALRMVRANSRVFFAAVSTSNAFRS